MGLGERTEIAGRNIWVEKGRRRQRRFSGVCKLAVFTAALGSIVFGQTSASLADDTERGEKLYKSCKSCHQIGEGARNGVGPHLDGLFGRVAGSIDGFKYSNAMKAKGEDGLIWDEASLDQYLAKPRAFVPGTRMSYLGMKKAEDRIDLIGYLKALSQAAPSSHTSAAAAPRAEIGSAAMQIEGDVEYGEYLSSECVTCHQLSGHADGIPSVVGWPKEAFIRALFEYKTNVRTNQVMQNMTVNLGNEEIAALAAYFGSLDPQ